MILNKRVIPALLISSGRLVKTRKFKDSKYIGDPINAIRIFNEKEVDELILLDISASKNNIEPDYKLLEMCAGECFMPLCYGGGIKTLDQASKIFNLGIEKICINSAVIEDFSIVSSISNKYGNQAIVASIDIKKNFFGQKQIYSSKSKTFYKNIKLNDYLRSLEDSGVGEILLNSVDNDGMLCGLDLNIINEVSMKIKIPLIALGGVSSIIDINDGFNAGASAVAAGSFFVLSGPHRAVLISYPNLEELNSLTKNRI
jgi:cyclase